MVIFKRRLGEKWQVSSMTIRHPQWSAMSVSLIHRSVVLVSASLVAVMWFKMDEVTSVRQFRWATRVQDGFTQKLFVYQKGWDNHPPTLIHQLYLHDSMFDHIWYEVQWVRFGHSHHRFWAHPHHECCSRCRSSNPSWNLKILMAIRFTVPTRPSAGKSRD